MLTDKSIFHVICEIKQQSLCEHFYKNVPVVKAALWKNLLKMNQIPLSSKYRTKKKSVLKFIFLSYSDMPIPYSLWWVYIVCECWGVELVNKLAFNMFKTTALDDLSGIKTKKPRTTANLRSKRESDRERAKARSEPQQQMWYMLMWHYICYASLENKALH